MSGVIPLFRFAGIRVFLHWSWFLVAAYFITSLVQSYRSPIWGVYEYLALFVIVLLHEFGHALACRSVGGEADRIILWPLGGVAFVNPPQRPGATLWSIAAGPLVNVALIPVIGVVISLFLQSTSCRAAPDACRFLVEVRRMNYGLLIFNLLPIYPLDGGQILRALLWFPLGQIRSLQIASVVGLVGGAVLVLLALYVRSTWFIILWLFVLNFAAQGWRYARALAREEKHRTSGPGDFISPRQGT